MVAQAAADAAPGRRVMWTPTLEEAGRRLAGELGEGDVLLTLGAGNVDRAGAGARRERARGHPGATSRWRA